MITLQFLYFLAITLNAVSLLGTSFLIYKHYKGT